MRIGVDLMGSESSPYDLYPAVVSAAAELGPSDSLHVFAVADVAADLARGTIPSSGASVVFSPVSEMIAMDESPLIAARRKKDSSMVVGVRLLKESQIDALVSPGNTGALIASATMLLTMLPGIDRPALLAVLPTHNGNVAVLDVGGNVSVKAPQLVQFAIMGSAYQQCYRGLASPRVGLLNIGSESLKGTSHVREAYRLLEERFGAGHPSSRPSELTFIGNVEGREVFQGKVDVLVTDGFTGNVFLKTAEGVSSFLLDEVRHRLQDHPGLRQALGPLQHHVDFEEYPGAIVCGVNGLVIKCHGYSSSRGMLNGIRGAANLLRHRLLDKMRSHLKSNSLSE